MGSVRDIGSPGVPLADPALTAWQAAVRDALNSTDTTVDNRISTARDQGRQYTDAEIAEAAATGQAYTDAEIAESAANGQAYADGIVTVSPGPPTAPPERNGLIWVMVVPGEPEPIPTIYVSSAGAWTPIVSGPGGLDIDTANALFAPIDRPGASTTEIDWDTIDTPGTYGLLMAPDAPNGPGTVFFYYAMVFAYGTTGNITQLAVPYNDPAGSLYIRHRYAGTYSSWSPIGAPGVTVHGELTGLDADDHPQYLNITRGDARYPRVTVGPSAPSNPTEGDIWVVT